MMNPYTNIMNILNNSDTNATTVTSDINDDNNNNHHHNHNNNISTENPTKTSFQFVDTLLSAKMNNMSLQERSNGLHDLHGVAELEKEIPEVIEAKIKEMNQYLNSYTKNNTSNDYNNHYNDNSAAATTTTTQSSSSSFFWNSFTHKLQQQSVGTAATITTANAYKLAMMRSPKYVEQWKLSCLRAEEYNSQDAALRLIRFFDRKRELFGNDLLVKHVRFCDLTEKDQKGLRNGIAQVLSQRDRAGRAILFINGCLNVHYETGTVMRVIMYLAMAALQDHETQRRGIVAVFYGVGMTTVVKGRSAQIWKSWESTPWRFVAVHYCQQRNFAFTQGTLAICKAMGNKNVSRFRIHTGSHVECIYNLLTFGIPKDALPIDTDGNIGLTLHHHMLKVLNNREQHMDVFVLEEDEKVKGKSTASAMATDPPGGIIKLYQETDPVRIASPTSTDNNNNTNRTTSKKTKPTKTKNNNNNNNNNNSNDIDTSATTSEMILIPGPMDVLMGRGRHPESRPGAMRLRNMLLEHQQQYENSTKAGKTALTEHIYNEMKQRYGCRFLATHPTIDGYFYECNDTIAKDKISHGFRNLRLKKSSSSLSSSTTAASPSSSSSRPQRQSSSSSSTTTSTMALSSSMSNIRIRPSGTLPTTSTTVTKTKTKTRRTGTSPEYKNDDNDDSSLNAIIATSSDDDAVTVVLETSHRLGQKRPLGVVIETDCS